MFFQFDPLPIESKTAATAVLMLSSPEEEVLAKACEAIHKFAEKGNCHLILFSHRLKVTGNFAEVSSHYIPMCGSPLSTPVCYF